MRYAYRLLRAIRGAIQGHSARATRPDPGNQGRHWEALFHHKALQCCE